MIPAIVFLFGALFGSFFYTLAVRFIDGTFAEKKYKALFDFSRCPKCGKRIKAFYLIPVFGFLVAKGKCSECGAGISIIYPLTEIFYGILAIAVFFKFGLNAYSISIYLILGLSVSISIIDIRIMRIPNSLIIIFVALSIYPVVRSNSLPDNLYGFLLMAGFFLVVLLVFPGSFGGGDAKFAAASGILLGFNLAIVALEAALITGSIAGAIYAVKSGQGLKIKMPFAPFIAAGIIIALFFGREILFVYYRIFY